MTILLDQPTPGEIVRARERAGHTLEAAQMCLRGNAHRANWLRYESGRYLMSRADWTLYLLLTDQHPSARVVLRE